MIDELGESVEASGMGTGAGHVVSTTSPATGSFASKKMSEIALGRGRDREHPGVGDRIRHAGPRYGSGDLLG
ncbi:hypothetical protein Ae717Ps2_5930 [Pseudonocardia sp. Ae717_Ps2]|nr:hypothetical protein Ae717Ps2_5885 [Pseudonocardia sp. Ae717_Ps2]OLM29006.1 hypothetical protein Ae717Ps2_5930 [Pseudonocardia sp. Ae717_Ps2]